MNNKRFGYSSHKKFYKAMKKNGNPISPLHAALVLILLGAPGSGKGTQAKKLAAEYHIPHISTGDIFREQMAADTPLGKQAKGYIQAGQLVPDPLVLDMLAERVSQADCEKGYVLDGFPRTIPQAEALSNMLKQKKLNVLALSLDVPNEEIVKRADGRLICKQCGSIYQKETSPPKRPNVCDKCQGELYQRADDQPKVVLERLKVYHKQTHPLLDYYQKEGILAHFNGNQSPEKVQKDLQAHINKQAH